jgi:hypothetical protein
MKNFLAIVLYIIFVPFMLLGMLWACAMRYFLAGWQIVDDFAEWIQPNELPMGKEEVAEYIRRKYP